VLRREGKEGRRGGGEQDRRRGGEEEGRRGGEEIEFLWGGKRMTRGWGERRRGSSRQKETVRRISTLMRATTPGMSSPATGFPSTATRKSPGSSCARGGMAEVTCQQEGVLAWPSE